MNRKHYSKDKIVQLVIKIVPILLFILLWQVVSSNEIINSKLFPPPTEVLDALLFWIKSGVFWVDVNASIWRMLAGFLIGSLLGILAGMLTGRFRKINFTIVPLIQIFRPLPPVAIIPLVIVWLGIYDPAKIFSISFAVFFPVWINAHLGANSIPKNYLRSAGLLTTSKLHIFYAVLFPAALPSVIAGLRTAIPIAFVMVYVSEIAGASAGLGYRISISHLAYRIDIMMAALFVLALAGALTDLLFTFLVRIVFPWIKFL
ncbi:MAG: ABC transporter permease [Chitinophagaceae bacterium]